MPNRTALYGVEYQDATLRPAARKLASRLGVPLLEDADPELGLVLKFTREGLALLDRSPGAPGAVRVDFSRLRRRGFSLRSEAVARAVGLKGNEPLRVVDATAGLGRDGFVLASLGAEVVLLERNPVVAALLADGLARAAADPALAAAAARLSLIEGEATERLPELSADAVYLDPMYPQDGTRAQVKKEMQLLRRLLGPDPDVESLFQAAWASPARRIVLKRPRRSSILPGPKPSHSQEGRSTRFDVYVRV